MYIELDASQRDIPQIAFKKPRHSNLIKKSELALYSESRILLRALEARVNEYQGILEQQVITMLEDKDQGLNEYLTNVYQEVTQDWQSQQNEWFKCAELEFARHLEQQQEMLEEIKRDLKQSIAMAIERRFSSLKQSETLITYLTEVLHNEMDDQLRELNITKNYHENGVLLTIESEDSVISIDTQNIVNELRVSLGLL
ncbi:MULTISPECIES: hypothetical protein [Vibrio]|uniref:Uncharacterized protein n=1 Tax=Vibrio aestuarianus TaxID=28171 RepID=A0ABD7YR23_9VIBR|nr:MULTISPECIES: hypothetical protein [Vibrio]MDE1231369.1 hypothetical protein [Vibrio aestuarianus]MDE1330288.1 hypothetical protein [Vibrio aestuarianus]MDE1331372.1 hypothetical protein [Vibrio aestuarianus]MDF9398535.1 hypothetical protein [Vibrio sp. 1180_3]WGK86932.1 hypothetical protein PYE67_18505 [Vibrio aestuarianus]